ncbi:MAG: amino acid-binding protein [Prevotella sp.]|nr:amino acid-binding protein [Prevotella sp.]
MTINQLSIFIENRSGTLVKVLQVLKQSNIQLISCTIADTAEYGILRLICAEPTRAYEELKAAGVAVALSDVFAIELDNEPGRGADAISTFSDAGISIVYLYSFMLAGKGILVFRTDDAEKAKDTIRKNNLKVITEKELETLV